MNLRPITLFFWGFLIASAAMASERHETHIKVVSDENGEVFEWQSSDPDADFSDLEVGESRTVTGDDGKEVTVTRTEDGIEFDVDGRKIDLMAFDGDGDVTIDIEKSENVRIIKTDDPADVTIISSDEIDDETRARIEAVLKDAGKDGEILFLDGNELGADAQAHGEHEVRIIRKELEETN
ncbi:MAG: hypothetical protein P8Y01_01095 [Woeseiaceae bacterium]